MPMKPSPDACRDLKVLSLRPACGGEGGDLFELTLEHPGWPRWKPGQFVMVRPVSFGTELIWGRPISICDVDERGLRLLVQVAGRGTTRMAALAPGELVTVWGPLGTSFAVEDDAPTLMLAGGIGIAPFVGYARRHPKPGNLRLLFGHRPPAACYPLADFEGIGDVRAMREEKPGDLDDFVETLGSLMRDHAHGGLVLACGPLPFLRTVRRLAVSLHARCQLSLENKMACGIGACLGCVVKNREGDYVQSCAKGPVLWADEMQFEEGR